MNVHLEALHFRVGREPGKPKLRTMVHLAVPYGFLEALQAPKIFPSLAFDQLERDLKLGLDRCLARRWGDELQKFQAELHLFVQVEHIQCRTMEEDVEILREAAGSSAFLSWSFQ